MTNFSQRQNTKDYGFVTFATRQPEPDKRSAARRPSDEHKNRAAALPPQYFPPAQNHISPASWYSAPQSPERRQYSRLPDYANGRRPPAGPYLCDRLSDNGIFIPVFRPAVKSLQTAFKRKLMHHNHRRFLSGLSARTFFSHRKRSSSNAPFITPSLKVSTATSRSG